jgi:putative hydrolase of the HAD superfamily
MGTLRTTVEADVTEVSFATFVDALAAANEELAGRRAESQQEFSSVERFTLALLNAGYVDGAQTRALARRLSSKHMELLRRAVEIPPGHVDFLARLARRYPLALVSNFDHGATAREILRRDGAAAYFDPIVISDEHGWRKPHPSIFADTLATLGVAPEDALYVGDSVEDDIVGAKGAGLDIAWVNPRGKPAPATAPKPDYEIETIPDLGEMLL